MNKLVKLAKVTNQKNNKKSPSTIGVNNKNTKIAVGIVPRARKGNLLPYLDLQLSERDPIIGSVIASNTEEITEANPANRGGNPST